MVSTKTPCQKNSRKKKVVVAAEPVQGGSTHGENKTFKKIETEKTEKILKELLYTAQMAHWYSGSKISKTSNSSNSNRRSNNSNFGGSGLAGPPLCLRISSFFSKTMRDRPHTPYNILKGHGPRMVSVT